MCHDVKHVGGLRAVLWSLVAVLAGLMLVTGARADEANGNKYQIIYDGVSWKGDCEANGFFATPLAAGNACIPHYLSNLAASGWQGCGGTTVAVQDNPRRIFFTGTTCTNGNPGTAYADYREVACVGSDFDIGGPCGAQACDANHPDVGAEFVVSTEVPATACNPITHCLMKRGPGVCMGSSCVWKVTHTNQNCASSGDPSLANEPPGEECVTDGSDEFCMSQQGDQNCGYFNDNFVCLSKVERDGCAVFPDGSRVCGPEASTPPAPDNGTPGVRATPDKQVNVTNTTNTTTINNYYNATTVANSARPPGTSGDNPHDGRDDGSGTNGGGGGGGDGDGEGESVEGGLTCEAAPVCSGDALECMVIHQSWRNRCVDKLNEDELDEMFAGEGDVDGDGTIEGRGEGLPGSGDDPINVMEDFDSDGWLGARSCPASYTVSLPSAFGGGISYSLTDACFFFQLIGSLVLIIAWFQAARIVVTGFM